MVKRANLDGSDQRYFAIGNTNPTGVAVDANYLYWTTGGDGPSSGAVNQAGLDGSNSQPIVTGLAYTPGTVAVGASYLYWVNRGDDTVHLANLDGSNPQTLGSGQGAWGTGGKPRRTCRLTTVHTVARHPAGTLADRPDRPLPRR
jgi:hypothetical protein